MIGIPRDPLAISVGPEREPPLWARLYHLLETAEADAAVRRTMQEPLLGQGLAEAAAFPWRMRNGAWLAISPLEGTVPYMTVGWTCFVQGEWEPHVERCLRRVLAPGEVAADIGANLGYFTAVMAQAVGPAGRVHAFEPLPSTHDRLAACRALNAFAWVEPHRLAVGAADGAVDLFSYERATGNASLYKDPIARLSRPQAVEMRALDGLLAEGRIPPPDLIKVDIEGHELQVLLGARETLRTAQPWIVVELNERMSRLAGWEARDLRELLASAGEYAFAVIGEERLTPIDLASFAPSRNTWVDLLAWSPRRADRLPELPSGR